MSALSSWAFAPLAAGCMDRRVIFIDDPRFPGGRRRQAVPCTQCAYCIRRKQQAIAGRLVAELAASTGGGCFTLTIADNWLSDEHSTTDFWKSEHELLRKRISYHLGVPYSGIKYLIAAELGERNLRPHAHICLTGLGTVLDRQFQSPRWWKYGHVHQRTLDAKSAYYCTGYFGQISKQDLKLLHSRSDKLGEDWFHGYCTAVLEALEQGRRPQIPVSTATWYPVGTSFFPMDRRFIEVGRDLGFLSRPTHAEQDRIASELLSGVVADGKFNSLREVNVNGRQRSAERDRRELSLNAKFKKKEHQLDTGQLWRIGQRF